MMTTSLYSSPDMMATSPFIYLFILRLCLIYFASLFLFLLCAQMRALLRLGKMLFMSLQKFFSFLSYSRFRILESKVWNKKDIVLHNLGNKLSLVIKLPQYMRYHAEKIYKEICEKCDLEPNPRSFFIKRITRSCNIVNAKKMLNCFD